MIAPIIQIAESLSYSPYVEFGRVSDRIKIEADISEFDEMVWIGPATGSPVESGRNFQTNERRDIYFLEATSVDMPANSNADKIDNQRARCLEFLSALRFSVNNDNEDIKSFTSSDIQELPKVVDSFTTAGVKVVLTIVFENDNINYCTP